MAEPRLHDIEEIHQLKARYFRPAPGGLPDS